MSEEFVPVERVDGDHARGLLLICDHARNALPPKYGTLGLPASEFSRHIAYDIGARAVTLGLAARLGVPAVLSTFSRLLIDPNRGEDDPTLVMRLSDGTVVPGNHPISEAEIEYRKKAFHQPYHRAVGEAIECCFATGVVPAVFSIHSFTEAWKGNRRPWEVALLWDSDPRFTKPLIAALSAVEGMTVGDNQPYDGALRNDTMYHHCTRRGIAHSLIEIRQDLIADQPGVDRWVDLLAPMLEKVNALAEIHQVRHFGSRTGPVEPAWMVPGAVGQGDNTSDTGSATMDETTRTELEAAAFRRLVSHLRERTDVQNIDLMNLAGFCRNCLANWYKDAAEGKGIDIDKLQAREIIYGMPYEEWRARYQTEAGADKKAAYEKNKPSH